SAGAGCRRCTGCRSRSSERDSKRGKLMGVYFVYRSHYDSPSGKQVTRFEDDTVSDWFRRNWELGRAQPERASELFAFEVYGFSLFSRAEEIEQPPDTPELLAQWLQEEIYAE